MLHRMHASLHDNGVESAAIRYEGKPLPDTRTFLPAGVRHRHLSLPCRPGPHAPAGLRHSMDSGQSVRDRPSTEDGRNLPESQNAAGKVACPLLRPQHVEKLKC